MFIKLWLPVPFSGQCLPSPLLTHGITWSLLKQGRTLNMNGAPSDYGQDCAPQFIQPEIKVGQFYIN